MLIIGLEGPELTDADRRRLTHPGVAGAILFVRNIVDRAQSMDLITQIRDSREMPLLICVDQEGGPVQRFRAGYSLLPPLLRIGQLYDRDRARALALAAEHAWLMASEMRAIGIDLSYAPVVDVARGNKAIGERAFHADPVVCAELATVYVRAMRSAGMRATAKHFPGHGSVLEDTHFTDAIDRRPWASIAATDLLPFRAAIDAGVEAVMMAHVTYPMVDPVPAGYSEHWIRRVLRDEMGFDGVVVSDDIAMVAAEGAGAIGRRVQLHLDAGCDVVLVCRPEQVDEALEALPWDLLERSHERLLALAGTAAPSDCSPLQSLPRYRAAVEALSRLA